MRVLIVNTTERTGGAAIAANRLAKALRQEGAEVAMATRNIFHLSLLTFHFSLKPLAFYGERLRIFIANRLSKHNLWQIDLAYCGEDITRRPEFQQADVIHLHWINQGFLSMKSLKKILQSGKRIVWTLHDQWPYTGICHYTEECDHYQTHCHHCPLLSPPADRDLSYQVFEQKLRVYREGNITFVGCSQWIADEARKSPLTEGHRIVSIPNAIDHTTFHPIPKREARRQFFGKRSGKTDDGLPDDKPIVLFICQKVTDERKGVRYLEEAIKQLPDVRVIRVGQGGDYEIRDERRMALLYAAADVFVTPSLQDNLPNTIVEAMSCGTPCVGFHVGGIPEMIHHLVDGYVARYRDADDLAQGIRYVLAHPELAETAAQYARETYDEHRVAQLYMAEYWGK
ncbi:MAG: glycosyltransferase family 4 protein [Bacteroidaceae bacterium]|nr:glycosyltransferase family 4 protein [Bacteroidaceae bacterium]